MRREYSNEGILGFLESHNLIKQPQHHVASHNFHHIHFDTDFDKNENYTGSTHLLANKEPPKLSMVNLNKDCIKRELEI